MSGKLERIFEYRVLLSKMEELRIPLSEQEATRLDHLSHQLPLPVPPADQRDPYTVLSTPLHAQFVAGGHFGSGMVCNASAGGLAITTPKPPELGERLIVHVREDEHGIEYTFPCTVISRVVKGVMAMGVSFEGVPTQSRLGGRSSGVWRPDAPTQRRPSRKPNTA